MAFAPLPQALWSPVMSAEAIASSIVPGVTAPYSDTLDPELAALSTLSLLNVRLSRLEYLLKGYSAPTQDVSRNVSGVTASSTSDIPTRLRDLETRLNSLKRLDGLPGNLVRMVDQLRRQYPEVLPLATRDASQDEAVSTHELSTRASEVLSNSTLFTTTSAHLQTLQTLRIPSANLSANLINATPRLQKLKERQIKLDQEIAQLKSRSADVVEWWMQTGVLGMGELWDDWEDRVTVCERALRREERRRKEDG